MPEVLLVKYVKCFALLPAVSCFIQTTEAQKKKAFMPDVFKKLVRKGSTE